MTKDESQSASSATSNESDSEYSYQVTTSHLKYTSKKANVVADSGCSISMRLSTEKMSNVAKDKTSVNLADGLAITLTARGKFDLGFKDSSQHSEIAVPLLKEILLSVSRLADTGVVSVFDKDKCTFYRSPTITGTVLGHAPRRGGLYY